MMTMDVPSSSASELQDHSGKSYKDDYDDAEQQGPLKDKSSATSSVESAEDAASSQQGDMQWRRMAIDVKEEDEHDSVNSCSSCFGSFCRHKVEFIQSHLFALAVALVILAVLCGAGISICFVVSNSRDQEMRDEALELAQETGAWFSAQLDQAILPLFSLAQFAAELKIFRDLPAQIGPAHQSGSLPLIPDDPMTHRNVTGVCDQPALVNRFTEIAATIKRHAGLQGVLVNLQLAPQAVVCLLHPLNNTEDFENGVFMDNTGAVGLDLLTDPDMRYIAESALVKNTITIAGPLQLRQCQDCDATVRRAFIARLPVEVPDYEIVVNGVAYERWGFATALINWEKLVTRSHIYETFQQRGMKFQLTRTDQKFNTTNNSYYQQVVTLAEIPGFDQEMTGNERRVTTTLQTTNNEWQMTVVYNTSSTGQMKAWVITSVAVLSLCISILAYLILTQKQIHTQMKGAALAQDAKVETERNMTAYFAHELRNPLGAIDSALSAMPDDLPDAARDLVSGMQLCSTFMSQVMNNLLDCRKIEEGKMTLEAEPLSLRELITDIHKMLLPSVKSGVAFVCECNTDDRDWVLADRHRLQQVVTNVVTNAIKYTFAGSITLRIGWQDDSLVKFECKDTGPGIPLEEQGKVFGRFVQRGSAPGSGLGLAIAKRIVDLMGGTIGFQSDPAVEPGTTCIVMLPLKACQEPQGDEAANEEAVLPIEDPLSFLIIDDVKMNRLMLKKRLQKGIAPNCTITEASTGEEALEICGKELMDVIIVDHYMEEAGGVMVGTDVAYAMRRMRIESVIIGCSGNNLREEFTEAGADWVWQKPLPSNAEIISHLRQALAKRQTR